MVIITTVMMMMMVVVVVIIMNIVYTRAHCSAETAEKCTPKSFRPRRKMIDV